MGCYGVLLLPKGTDLFDMNLESFLSNFRGSCHFVPFFVYVGLE